MSRRAALALAAILLVGAGLRVAAAARFETLRAGGDPLYYLYAAASLARGEGLDYRKPHWSGTHWPPGQSAFLALFADREALGRGGDDSLAYLRAFHTTGAQVATALLSVLGIALAVELGRRCFDLRTGLLAGAILALLPEAIGVSHTLYAESNFLVLLLLALVLGSGSGGPAPLRRDLATGLAFGAAAYFRSIALPLALPAALRALAGPRRRPILAAAAVLGGALLAIAPWTARNYLRYDRFLLLDTSGGETMFLGNNDFPPMTMDRWQRRRAGVGRPRCGLPNPVDNFRCEVANGLAHVAAHPGLFAARTLERVVGLANPTSLTVAIARPPGLVYGEGRAALVALLSAGSFTLLALAAILGLAGGRYSPDRLALAATLVLALGIPATMQAEARYRIAALPALVVFAAHFGVEARSCLARLREPLRAAGAALGLAWLAAGWIRFGGYLLG